MGEVMKWFYSIFVSDKELVNALPLFYRGDKSKEALTRFVNYMRKQLFLRKLKRIYFWAK